MDCAETDSTKNSNESLNEEYEIVNETLDSDGLDKFDNFFDDNSREEKVEKYLKFYLHFGACCLVWFIYLPVLIFICSFLSELYRFRLILGIVLNKINFLLNFFFLRDKVFC